MRSRTILACAVLLAASACSRSSTAGTSPETAAAANPPETAAANLPATNAGEAGAPVPDPATRAARANYAQHDEACRPERYAGFASEFPCEFDSDCVPCECRPVNRAEHARLGGDAYCERFNQPPAREECIATNPACCDGRCVLAR